MKNIELNNVACTKHNTPRQATDLKYEVNPQRKLQTNLKEIYL